MELRKFLPAAYEVWEKVMFLHMFVCPEGGLPLEGVGLPLEGWICLWTEGVCLWRKGVFLWREGVFLWGRAFAWKEGSARWGGGGGGGGAEIQSTGSRYASYWNAFLLLMVSDKKLYWFKNVRKGCFHYFLQRCTKIKYCINFSWNHKVKINLLLKQQAETASLKFSIKKKKNTRFIITSFLGVLIRGPILKCYEKYRLLPNRNVYFK